MYNRGETDPADPWVSILDHHHPDNQMVYGESASPGYHKLLNAEGGMDVYIANMPNGRDSARALLAPTFIK